MTPHQRYNSRLTVTPRLTRASNEDPLRFYNHEEGTPIRAFSWLKLLLYHCEAQARVRQGSARDGL